MTALTIRRTEDEIVARINQLEERHAQSGTDFFGVARMELVSWLPFETAKPFLNGEATAKQWQTMRDEQMPVQDQATTYLDFAISKATGHRGLSAMRSVDHFDAWLWLLFDDEIYEEWAALPYENYGAPKLHKAAELLKTAWPTMLENADINRMAQGLPCRPGCDEGCGS
jgi:hypothetical protein